MLLRPCQSPLSDVSKILNLVHDLAGVDNLSVAIGSEFTLRLIGRERTGMSRDRCFGVKMSREPCRAVPKFCRRVLIYRLPPTLPEIGSYCFSSFIVLIYHVAYLRGVCRRYLVIVVCLNELASSLLLFPSAC